MTAGPDGFRDPVPNKHAASKADTLNGFFGSSFRPIVISCCSFTPASTRGSGGHWLLTDNRPARCRGPHGMSHSLFNPVRSHVAARSPEARKDRVRQSAVGLRRWRCPADCPAVHPARRHTRLEVDKSRDSVIPALDPATSVGRAADANDGCGRRVRGAVSRLMFGAAHRCFTDQWTGHCSTPNRYVTFEPRSRSWRGSSGGDVRAPVHFSARHQRPCCPGHLVGECHGHNFARLAL
jgi:hypothetical protein